MIHTVRSHDDKYGIALLLWLQSFQKGFEDSKHLSLVKLRLNSEHTFMEEGISKMYAHIKNDS